jgi:Uma2 family endonuclease
MFPVDNIPMSQIQLSTQPDIFYPETDGQPMGENTIQFRWIVKIQQNLNSLFIHDPNVFVAGDLFWYPVEGDNSSVYAPDVMVVFGRPKGDRMSYLQWSEANIPPQVVVEILSPSNTKAQMERKLAFYQRYGVEEYYIYNPGTNYLEVRLRNQDRLNIIPGVKDWVSPRLQIRFVLDRETLQLYHPNGEAFTTHDELVEELLQTRQDKAQAEQARLEAEQARLNSIPQLLRMGLSVGQVAEACGFSVSQVQEIAERTVGE